MPFEKVQTNVDFPAMERATLQFWDRIGAFELLRAKNRGKPRWSFLDGPITANNPMGVHHAWGRTYKDAFQRYFAMTGHELRYQNGFDCQGLWVEVEVEKELKLSSKRDIENLVPGDRTASIARFVELCKARVDKYARVQTEQSIRLGYWMDWDRTDADWAKSPDERRSYFTMSQVNNYTIWGFLKRCHERGLIYRGSDVMPWSGRGGTAYSQMEVVEGRKLTVHTAPFVRFPLVGRDREFLLVWTTTPWTLTSNVAAAVNPQLLYAKVRSKRDGCAYWLAKDNLEFQRLAREFKEGFGKPEWTWPKQVPKLKTLAQMFKEQGGYEVEEVVPGAALVGLEYVGPFDELPAQQQAGGYPADPHLADRSGVRCHRVIDGGRDHEGNPNVTAGEGTGIVHIAPGCGDIDHVLGKQHGLVAIAPLDEEARFTEAFGPFAGLEATAPQTVQAVLESLRSKGLLFAVEEYPHVYPHCWRTGVELVFRPVEEWFISMSWREEIMRVCEQATWLPESINAKARELDWLRNMGDWMISKKRFWGLALPIWVDPQTGDFEVIGSREELRQRAVEGWEQFEGHTPHRPWVDAVKIRNPKTGNLMHRVPDVGNPWLDAGIVPFSTLGYHRDRAEWAKWFPADLVTESFPGQFRNWFYSLLAMSTMLEGRAPFRTLLGHALVRDQEGREMHKSAGNSIPFEGAADEGYTYTDSKGVRRQCAPMSADVIRWLYCRHNPAHNINFGPDPADEVRAKVVLKLWNTYAFFCNYARLDHFDPLAPAVPLAQRSDLDRWILSDLQLLVQKAHEAFRSYQIMDFCLAAEHFIDDRLSNWYVRRSRRRFWKNEQGQDKLAAYQTLYSVLTTLCKLLAPIVPFLTEAMYQNLRTEADPLSVHLCDYPQADLQLVDADLSADMQALLRLVSLGSAVRNSVKIKVRQPLAQMRVNTSNERDRRAVERFADQLAEELNVKRVVLHDPAEFPLLTTTARLNLKTAGPKFGPLLKDVQAALASVDAHRLAEAFQGGGTYPLALANGQTVELTSEEVLVEQKPGEGWAGLQDHGTQVGLDIRITPELAAEGMARDVIRLVQESRKNAGLEVEDRITLCLTTDSEKLAAAIAAHRDTIAAETLTAHWADQPLNGASQYTTEVKVDGLPLAIALAKVS
jgi:isoleucyl-tRNA synthetase